MNLELSKEQSRELVYDELEGYKVIQNEPVSTTRWSIISKLIFQDLSTGKFYEGVYSEGLTEQQDEKPFEYTDPNWYEVEPKEVTVTKYVKI